jgi:hypothetical protein
MQVELPSGLVVEMRPWSLEDMGAMAIRAANAREEDALVLDAVAHQHVATIDSGPYVFVQPGDVHFDWKSIMKVDVLWALYRTRVASFPDQPKFGLTSEDYTFEYRCPDTTCEGQKRLSIQKVRLCDLKVRKLPAASAVVMRSSKSFEVMVAGKLVKYVLPTFALDAPLREHVKREKKRTKDPRRPTTPAESIAAQVTFIEGVKASDRDLAARAKWLGGLMASEWVPLRDAITESAAFVGNRVDARCDVCGRVTTMGLPLGPTFFAPADRSEELLDEAAEEETKKQEEEQETSGPSSASSS